MIWGLRRNNVMQPGFSHWHPSATGKFKDAIDCEVEKYEKLFLKL